MSIRDELIALCKTSESFIAGDGYTSVGFRTQEEIADGILAHFPQLRGRRLHLHAAKAARFRLDRREANSAWRKADRVISFAEEVLETRLHAAQRRRLSGPLAGPLAGPLTLNITHDRPGAAVDDEVAYRFLAKKKGML